MENVIKWAGIILFILLAGYINSLVYRRKRR